MVGFISKEEYKKGYTTLYHGTDARVVAMSIAERKQFLDNCRNALNSLWELYEPLYMVSEEFDITTNVFPKLFPKRKIDDYKELLMSKNEYIYHNLLEKLFMIDSWKKGIQQYQYGDLYLTSFEMKAEKYALRSFAGGELGLMVYRLVEAADIIGLDYSQTKDRKAIEQVMDFAKDESKEEPVVIMLPDVPIKNLLSDSGMPLDETIATLIQDFRYVGDYYLDLKMARYLKR